MEKNLFNIQRLPEKTILKVGKKKWAEITYNNNPDYKWTLWLQGGGALSGYETEDAAIERAEAMRSEWIETINNLKN